MNPSEEVQASKKYRLIAEIGRGGMADVYLAVVQGPAGFNKLVVLKKARPELLREPEFLAMFLDEARLAARLNHPNVVQTLEVGQDGERYFIAMEYLDGQPLHRVRSRVGAAGGGFTLAMQVRVMIDALNGLHYAHELGDFDGTQLNVVHRDATPQNIFITYDGLVKVVDFGIAKAVDSSSETRTGIIKGKVPYMAPEQAKGEPVDRRTDIFAVGVMLWEAAVGRRMWKGVADIGVLTRLATGDIPSLRASLPDVNPMFARIVDKALATAAADRYATAADLQHDLERYLEMSGQPMTAREIGKFVAERFAEDWVRIKGLIEGQLKDIRWSGAYPRATGVDLPKIDAGPIMVTPTGSRPMASNPSMPSISGLSEASKSLTSLTAASPPDAPREPRGVSRKVLAVAAAGALVIAGLTVVVGRALLSSQAPAGAGSGAPSAALASGEAASAASSAAAPAGAAPAEVALTVRVTPAKAKLFLDGAPLAAGSYEGKLKKDGATHYLRAESPGFVTKDETITATSDVQLSLSLEKDSGAPAVALGAGPGPVSRPADKPAAPPVTAAPVATPPAPTPGLGPGQKPKRAIDSDSPYAQ